VALSFAGAQRDYLGQVAAALKARGVRCLYDKDEQARLVGRTAAHAPGHRLRLDGDPNVSYHATRPPRPDQPRKGRRTAERPTAATPAPVPDPEDHPPAAAEARGQAAILGREWVKSGQGGQAPSIIRSWIAIPLVIGLLIFCAATLLGNDTSLQSILFGGLIANTGAAIAFYFSSQGADKARADILNAVTTIGQGGAKPSAFSQITPPDGKVNAPYNYRIIADGSPVPTYSVVNGTLPDGLTLDTDGTVRGIRTTQGDSTFAIAAINSAGLLRSPDLTVTITAA
jgi:hypothetical protein